MLYDAANEWFKRWHKRFHETNAMPMKGSVCLAYNCGLIWHEVITAYQELAVAPK